MVDSSQIQAYLKGISRRYEQWRRDNALTDVIADQQESFTFKQFVQTEEKQSGDRLQKETKTYPLFEGIHHYLSNKSEHVLLVGSPGVGKSSALWHCLDTLATEELEASEPRIPVLVQLKAYRDRFIHAEDPHGLLTLIQNSLRPRLRLSLPEIDKLLCDQRLILLLDGLNEIPAGVFRTHLQQFRNECRELEIPLICSTREMGGGDLGIQRKLEIQPLNSGETDRFLQECLPEHQDQVRQLLQRDNRDLSRTPFVLWMLYHLLKETGTIAETLGEAFRKFFRDHCRSYKEDAPVSEERRKAWNLWMEHLAFTMLSSPDPLDPGLVITKEKAENILAERFGELQGDGSRILELEKYYLLAPVSDRETSFKHQLIQEYYAAEELFSRFENNYSNFLDDRKFQKFYLNYLKWTEAISLMAGIITSESHATRLVRLALKVDLHLSIRLIREVPAQLIKQLRNEANLPTSLKKEINKRCNINSIEIWKRYAESLDNSALIFHLKHGENHQKETSERLLSKQSDSRDTPALVGLLEDSELEIKTRAARILCQLRVKEAIPKLISLLSDKDFKVDARSTKIIADFFLKEDLFPLLIEKTSQSEVDALKKTVELLGASRSEQATEYFINILKEECDKEILKLIIFALLRNKAESAVPVLIEITKSEEFRKEHETVDDHSFKELHMSVAFALGNIGGSLATETLIQLLNDRNVGVRSMAAEMLGELGSEQAFLALDKAIEVRDVWILSPMIEKVEKISLPELVPKFLRLLSEENAELRTCAVKALGKSDDARVIPQLIGMLMDTDQYVRMETAESLGKLNATEAIPQLFELLVNPEESPCAIGKAAESLGRLGAKFAVPELLNLLNHSDCWVRWHAADALGYLKCKEGIQGLVNTLTDKDGDARWYAVKALGAFEEDSAAYVLPSLLNLQDTPYQKDIFEAIKAIQSNCRFYNYDIFLESQQASSQLDKVQNRSQNNFFRQKEYRKILSILHHMIRVMERDPKSFSDLGEEAIRSHFLVQLNGIYKGQATGETFNKSGKPDIVVRLSGENIFIGECKFWGGESKLKETLDQLLGYATGNDDQLGMLIFNRNKNFSAVLKQIPIIIKRHSSFLKEETHLETQFHFIVRHPDDPERELKLAVLAFDIPSST